MYRILGNLYQGPMLKELAPNMLPNAIVNLMSNEEIDLTIKSLGFAQQSSEIKAHIHLPIADGPNPGMDWLKMAVGIVESLMEKHTVYIHCRGGISRSAMLAAAVLMKVKKWRSHDKALNFLAEKNPSIDPAPNFVKILKEFEREV